MRVLPRPGRLPARALLARALAACALAAGALAACGPPDKPCPAKQTCGASCCAVGETCLGGSTCCLAPCGNTCCGAGRFCLDQGGKQRCIKACNDGSQCPKDAPCCGVFPGGSGCVVRDTSELQCRCTSSKECPTGCCAPLLDDGGNPSGPYVCKDSGNDFGHYGCCFNGLKSCPPQHCCVVDAAGNDFCAVPCADASGCGGGKARCASASSTMGACAAGPTFCAPPP